MLLNVRALCNSSLARARASIARRISFFQNPARSTAIQSNARRISVSIVAMPCFESATYITRALRKSWMAEIELTFAGPSIGRLPLLQVFFNPFGLADQERNISVGRFDKP